jgi:PAS domain-containing protein
MADKSLSCLVVAKDDIPTGILTERDILRMSGGGMSAGGLTVAQVMQRPVLTIQATESVAKAAALMREKGVRRLVVINGHRRIQGLATQSNVVKALESNYIQTLKEVIRDKEVELMAAYRNLREKTVYLDNILRSAMDMGIVAANIDFCINYYNPAAERLLGLPAREAVGKHIWEVHQIAEVPLERLSRGFQAIHKSMAHTFCIERKDIDGFRPRGGPGLRHPRRAGSIERLRAHAARRDRTDQGRGDHPAHGLSRPPDRSAQPDPAARPAGPGDQAGQTQQLPPGRGRS